MTDLLSRRAKSWLTFNEAMMNHLKNYTVPQYGDEGEDLASDYSAEECVKQAEKYLKRYGRNARPGEEARDLLKAAHYLQMAHKRITEA